MAIVRYNPWSEMNSLQRQLNRMFDDALTPTSLADFGNFSKFPAAELTENEDNLILKLEVPGMQLTELNIEATAKSISISGERKSETQSEESSKTRLSEGVSPTMRLVLKDTAPHMPLSSVDKSFRTEFRYGSFQRVIPLPARIQNTEVKAEYQNGILHLTLPKAEAEKNKVVKVNLSEQVNV